MKVKPVDIGVYEYGDVSIPQDLQELRLIAAKQPEGNHFMCISVKMFYQMTKKCLALDALLAKSKEKENEANGNESTGTSSPTV